MSGSIGHRTHSAQVGCRSPAAPDRLRARGGDENRCGAELTRARTLSFSGPGPRSAPMAQRDERKPTSRSPAQAAGAAAPASAAAADDLPTLSISREKICYIVIKVREFDVKDLPTVPDEASDAPDDGMREVL